jgi:GTP-binding protein
VPADFAGKVIEQVSMRKGEMLVMEPKGDFQHLEFNIPSRGIVGLRNNLLTATAGEAIIAHRFKAYEPWKGAIQGRNNGVLISQEKGSATAYAIDKLQDRGTFFIDPHDVIYEGQIIGEHIRPGDLVINVTKAKQLTNMRASGTDNATLEFIQEDEYVEVTPKSLRLRKIQLDFNERERTRKSAMA